MFKKIAFANIKKSIKDYTVYFLTLTLGVCIFYVFNSLDAQSAMMDITNAGISALESLVLIINVVSVFVSIILAFLIVYANQFMIKRRKKELGIYMTLGMPQSKISGMLLLETLLIGILALAAGLVLGIFLSQGLAVVTARLFQIKIVNFHFVFSKDAFFKSVVYFGIIYLVVMIFNHVSISKFKLIDLLQAEKRYEELKVRKKSTTIILMVLGILLILFSYYIVTKGGAKYILYTFAPGMAINVGGTLLFFMAFSGIMLRSMQANKKNYYKGLNMFTVRQLASKINTNFVSISFICTMLFLTIVVLSTVASFNSVFNAQTEHLTPYDASYTVYTGDVEQAPPIEELIAREGVDTEEVFSESFVYDIFKSDTLMKEIALPYTEFLSEDAARELIETSALDVIKQSDYNYLLAMQGKEGIQLTQDEYAVLSMQESMHEEIGRAIHNKKEVQVGGRTLKAAALPIQQEGLWTTSNGSYMDMMLVVPDDVAEGMHPDLEVLVGNFAGDEQQMEATDAMLRQNYDTLVRTVEEQDGLILMMSTRIKVHQDTIALTSSMIFVGLYIGMVFLIAAAAVLALQQLTEAADSKERYELLAKLGTSERMIHQSLFKQVALYFLMPLAMAIVHSGVGMYVMNEGIKGLYNTDVLFSAGAAALLIALIYGGYFLATYKGCKNIVRINNKRL